MLLCLFLLYSKVFQFNIYIYIYTHTHTHRDFFFIFFSIISCSFLLWLSEASRSQLGTSVGDFLVQWVKKGLSSRGAAFTLLRGTSEGQGAAAPGIQA